MKRCPECRLDYYDETLSFCLDDGAALVHGSVPLPDELKTAILSEPGAAAFASEQPTQTLTQKQVARRDETTPIHKTSSAEYIATEIKRHKLRAVISV
ncbi:MAG: hypothetical protein H0U23_16250, partial [Blastocatellia bacterium]|nr:hypothetical protein [Blastocatellia bacterium]